MSVKRYPPLPKSVDAPGGTVTVQRGSNLRAENNTACWGYWEPEKRLIMIDKSAEMRHQWKVLFHELHHVALDDSGLSHGMTDELVEACCDATATARVCERFGK